MSANPLESARRLQNPTIHASPWRYSSADTGAAAQRNRKPSWFGQLVPWVKIAGSRLEVRGHDTTSNGPDADFYDNQGEQPSPISSEGQYRIAEGLPATHEIELKQISALARVPDQAIDLLSELYNQSDFQKQATECALRARWEEAAISGNAGAPSATPLREFDGLKNLVSHGHGKLIIATSSQLSDIDRAMQEVIAHNRRVDLLVMNQASWAKLLALERDKGYRPDTRYNKTMGFEISYYSGVPICLSDHIPTTDGKHHCS